MITFYVNRFILLFVFIIVLIPPCIPSTKKRSVLTYPPHSVLQITAGISVKEDFKENHAGVSLAFQYNANLPNDTLSFLLPSFDSMREFSVFNNLKNAMDRYGYNSLECLKKMICQIAENPLRGGILEEIITFILTPSKHRSVEKPRNLSEQIENEDNMFLESELLGKRVGNCDLTYSKCIKTPLDFISYLNKI